MRASGIIAMIFALVAFGGAVAYRQINPPSNPDPNHTHADVAVWVGGMRLDFSDERYMSGSDADEQGGEHGHEHRHQYLHLHDGNGHVIHRHKPGLPLGEFFASIGLPMEENCVTIDDAQFAALDVGWKRDFALTSMLCDNGKFHWRIFVNGEERAFAPGYVFEDGDQLLLTYDAGDARPDAPLQQQTHDACLYSRTCPWRGTPPIENCIADPSIPCTVPVEDL